MARRLQFAGLPDVRRMTAYQLHRACQRLDEDEARRTLMTARAMRAAFGADAPGFEKFERVLLDAAKVDIDDGPPPDRPPPDPAKVDAALRAVGGVLRK
jgi:hypothetical protein